MLIQLLTQHPEAIVQVLKGTPGWVWGLFTGLLALGLNQLRDGRASLVRVTLMPVAMTGFSAWGTWSAFSASPSLGSSLLAWLACAAVLAALVAPTRSPATYDAATRSFATRGSVVPLLLIMGIFLTRYVVGVELAMQPQLAHDGQFTLVVGALYGVFNGLFIGRAARLWRQALRPAAAPLQASAA
ncbi:DUF6622 family protein [uncultured Ramlibacter sp.]|uniref:DUF6622 family protein n=1 Tax=uncultured Ramlibacter sp. TaxID=260755 RepID=UPI002612E285|nr:DUF6622 family protein [uncultured Ramlibacter sp.]